MSDMREKLADLIEEGMDSVHDMDVTFRQYAEAAAEKVLENVPGMDWEQSAQNAWDCAHYSIIEKRGAFSISYWSGRPHGLLNLGKRYSLAHAIAAASEHRLYSLATALGLTDKGGA